MELYLSLCIRTYDIILLGYTCVPGFRIGGDVKPFSISLIWCWSWPAKEGGSRGLAGYDSPREELLVLNTRAIFCLFVFFFGNKKHCLTAHSRIATTIANHSHPPSQPRYPLLEQLRIGGRRKSETGIRSGWKILSQWRSERSMRRSGRGKVEVWGRSRLVFRLPGPSFPGIPHRMHHTGISWWISYWDDWSLSWCMPQALREG